MRSTRRAALPALVALITVAGLLSAASSQAAPAQPHAAPAPGLPSTSSRWDTGASAVAPTTRAAAQGAPYTVARDGEVASLRTRTSRTFQRDGKMQTVLATMPVNYKTKAGTWAKIDDTLTPVAGGYTNTADDFAATVPATASAPVTAVQGSLSVSSTLLGAADAPAVVEGSTATYKGVQPGVDLVVEVRPDVVEQTFRLASAAAPRSYASTVDLAAGLTLAPADDRSLSIFDPSGAVVGHLPAPVLRDSGTDPDTQTSTAAHYTVAGSAPHYTVTTVVDGPWIDDPARVFPVALDPSITFGTASDLGCYVSSPGHSDLTVCASNSGTDNPLLYGNSVRNAYIKFGDFAVGSSVPADAVVYDAALTMTELTSSSGAPLATTLHRPSTAWTSSIAWGSQPFNTGVAMDQVTVTPPGVGGTVTFHATNLVQTWVSGANANYGFEMDSPTVNTMQFYGLANAAHHPTFTITWQQVVGQQSFIGAYDHQLTDRMDLHVDLADRNLVLNALDETMQGPGQSLTVRRTYNSLVAANGTAGAYGVGWGMSGGVDTGLLINRDAVTVTQPGGAQAVFNRDFTETDLTQTDAYDGGAGLNAVLTMTDATHYTLKFKKTHVVNTYTLPAAGASTARLTSVADGSGNTVTYTSTGSPLATTTITDTTGQRSVGMTYTGGVVTAMAETLPAGFSGSVRTWSYTYDTSGRLSTSVNTAGKTARYCYTGTTSNLITKVVTPRGKSLGATCSTTAGTDVTDIAYDATGHVTSITYENGASPITVAFSTQTALAPGPNGTGVTRLTDPYGKNTDYTYDAFDRVGLAKTPLGNTSSATFTTNNDVTASVSANNYTGGAGDPTTTSGYDANNNLTSVTVPGGAAVQLAYTDTANNPGQPTGVSDDRDSTGSTTGSMATKTAYNSHGQTLSSTKGGATVSVRHDGDAGVSHCGPSGAAAYPGAVCETRDADYNGSFPNRHRTLYSYNALGQLVTLTPAQPDNSRTTPPAEAFAYDGNNRLYTSTDSRGKTTTYTYDTNNRLTKTLYNNGTYTANTYDEDGDLLTTQDYTAAGVLVAGEGDAYTYDNLNRTATETQNGRAAITQTWDANSRLLTYDDGSGYGTLTYGYNDDGALTSAVGPGGSCTGFSPSTPPTAVSNCVVFNVDKGGARLGTYYPGGGELDTHYTTAGQIDQSRGRDISGAPVTNFDLTYAYTSGATTTAHVTSRTNSVSSSTIAYTYTDEGWLQEALTTSGGSTTANSLYCYDANGNRTSKSTSLTATTCPGGTTYTYDGANQQLGTGTSYDLSGDETSMPTSIPAASTTRTSTWSDSQQLASTALNGGSSLANSYFGAGNDNLVDTATSSTTDDQLRNAPLGISRVAHLTSGTETGRTYAERDPAGTIIALRDSSTGTHYYPYYDAKGSILRLVDNTGSTVDAYLYDPFGVQTVSTNGYNQPFGYTGAIQNTGTGLLHLGARWYDPTLGRFTQPDPVAHPTDTSQSSPYPYAGNDPINGADASGRSGNIAALLAAPPLLEADTLVSETAVEAAAAGSVAAGPLGIAAVGFTLITAAAITGLVSDFF